MTDRMDNTPDCQYEEIIREELTVIHKEQYTYEWHYMQETVGGVYTLEGLYDDEYGILDTPYEISLNMQRYLVELISEYLNNYSLKLHSRS